MPQKTVEQHEPAHNNAHGHSHDHAHNPVYGDACCGGSAGPVDSAYKGGSDGRHRYVFKAQELDCTEEVATLRREVGPLVGGDDRLAFDVLNGRMMVIEDAEGVSAEEVREAVRRRRYDDWEDHDFPPYGEDSSCDVFPSYEERPRPPRIPVGLALAVWMLLAIGAWWLADPLLGWLGGAVRSLADAGTDVARWVGLGREAATIREIADVEGMAGWIIELLALILKPAIVVLWAIGAAGLIAAPAILARLGRRRRGHWHWQAGRSRMCSFVLASDFGGVGRLTITSVVEKASGH